MHHLNPRTVYYTFSGGTSLAFALVFTVSTLYQINTVKLDALQLVLVGTVLELSVFLFEIPTGVIADMYSRRLSVIIGLVLTSIGFAILGIVPTFAGVLLAQIGWGIGHTFISGALDAWLADEIGEQHIGGVILRSAQIGRIAGIIGILLGTIGGNFDIRLPILTGSLAFLLLAIFLMMFMGEAGFTPVPAEERQGLAQNIRMMGRTTRDGILTIRRRPVLMTILLVGVLFGMASEGYDRLFEAHLIESIGLPPMFSDVTWFGILSMTGMIFSIIVIEGVLRRIKPEVGQPLVRMLTMLNVGIVVSTLAFALSDSFMIAVLLLLTRSSFVGLYYPLYTTWVNQGLDPRVRATVISMSSQVDALGQISSGPVIGLIGRDIGLRAALITAAGFLSPALLLYGRLWHKEQPETTPGTPASAGD